MNQLVKILGFPATLIHGDTLVWDRWRLLQPRLREHRGCLLDVGCGSGAFTIGAARMGYDALGLSWDERNQRVAQERAAIVKAGGRFDVCAMFVIWNVALICYINSRLLSASKLSSTFWTTRN